MRVLQVVGRLGGRGGAERHLQGVLAHLAERGVDVLVAAEDAPAGSPCPVARVPGLASRDRRAVGLEAVVRRFRPDVVHLQNVMNPAVLEWGAGQGALMTVQDHRFFCPGRGKWTLGGEACRQPMSVEVCAGCFEDPSYFREVRSLTEDRLRALQGLRVIVLSHYMKGELEAVGLGSSRIHVIPPFVHGLDPEAAPDGPPCLGFVGRIVAAKGIDDAVAAWRLSGLSLPLVFAGTGPERSRVESQGFEVLGWLEPRALSRFYRRCRAVVLPCRWQEPFGIVGIEALTMGTPVVAWRSGGAAEWCPPGGLVDWGDVEQLAQALRRIRHDDPPEPVRSFGAEGPMARLMALYDSTARRAPRRPA
jgi:glycosyltransferase involved in cell wall biosynthesis